MADFVGARGVVRCIDLEHVGVVGIVIEGSLIIRGCLEGDLTGSWVDVEKGIVGPIPETGSGVSESIGNGAPVQVGGIGVKDDSSRAFGKGRGGLDGDGLVPVAIVEVGILGSVQDVELNGNCGHGIPSISNRYVDIEYIVCTGVVRVFVVGKLK